jgi:hypothetical protein
MTLAPSTCRGRPANVCDGSSALKENVCAENNGNYYDYALEPMPHADKPDF